MRTSMHPSQLKLVLLVLLLTTLAPATIAERQHKPPTAPSKHIPLPAKQTKKRYPFDPPQHNFFPSETLPYYRQNWYSNVLGAMGEKPIQKQSDAKVNFDFRFLWLRSFCGPISIHITRYVDGKVLVVSKELSGDGSEKPAHLMKANEILWTENQFEQFLQQLNKQKFFQEVPADEELNGHDGAQWIFELNDSGRYHFIDRWSPVGEYRDLGIFLLKAVSLLPTKKSEIY